MRCSTPRSTRLPDSMSRWASRRIPISSAAAPWRPAALAPSLRICFWERATALAKRACSSATCSASMGYSGTCTAPDSTRCTVPMAIPEETPTPSNRRSPVDRRVLRSVFIELAADERHDRGQRPLRVRPDGRHLYVAAGCGRQHHQAHDRAPARRHLAPADLDLGLEFVGQLDELGRGPGMQPALIQDL